MQKISKLAETLGIPATPVPAVLKAGLEYMGLQADPGEAAPAVVEKILLAFGLNNAAVLPPPQLLPVLPSPGEAPSTSSASHVGGKRPRGSELCSITDHFPLRRATPKAELIEQRNQAAMGNSYQPKVYAVSHFEGEVVGAVPQEPLPKRLKCTKCHRTFVNAGARAMHDKLMHGKGVQPRVDAATAVAEMAARQPVVCTLDIVFDVDASGKVYCTLETLVDGKPLSEVKAEIAARKEYRQKKDAEAHARQRAREAAAAAVAAPDLALGEQRGGS